MDRLSSEEFDAKFYSSVHGGWVCRECGALTQDYWVHAEWHDALAFRELANAAARHYVKNPPAWVGEHTGPNAHDL